MFGWQVVCLIDPANQRIILQIVGFLDHLPISSCPRSYWTTPYSSSEVTTSPFRQSEWDCRLDHLLQDLETSVEASQRSQSSERTNNNNISKSNQKVQIEVEDLGADPTADTGLRHVVFLQNESEMPFVNFLLVKCNDFFWKNIMNVISSENYQKANDSPIWHIKLSVYAIYAYGVIF